MGFFLQSNIAVSHECQHIAVSSYDPVYQKIASQILYQYDCTLLYLLIRPWTQCYLVAHMHDERVHAVAFCTDGYSVAFGNQFPDFLHHDLLIFDNCTHIGPKISKICMYNDKNSYL